MRRTIVTAALAALVMVAVGLAWARDDDKPREPADALNHETLKQALKELRYEVEVLQSTLKTPIYKVKVEREGFRFVFFVSLSKDLSIMWASTSLRELPAKGKTRTDILEQMLLSNYKYNPAFFAVSEDRWVYLLMPTTNRGLTTEKIGKILDWYMAVIRYTQPLWDPTKYPPEGKAGTAAGRRGNSPPTLRSAAPIRKR